MGTLLEIGRHALEGVEVLFAFAATAAIGAGMIWGRHVDAGAQDRPPEAAELK